MLIIYLNFLIAIISDSYGKVMQKEIIVQYEAKIDVNFEITLTIRFLEKILFTMADASVYTLISTEE